MDFSVKFDTSKIEKYLKNLEKNLNPKYKGVKAGYFKDKKYPNGFEIAKNALLQNFGGEIKIPEHTKTLNFKIDKNGISRFSKQNKANFQQVVVIPQHIVKIPPRPFLNQAFEKKTKWRILFLKNLKRDIEILQNLKIIGEQMKNDIKISIDEIQDPPNSLSTIKKKKSTKPLIDTGLLKNSVLDEIIKNGNK